MHRTLARGVALLFAAIGAGGVIAPRLSAEQFGIPTRDAAALAFVRATAVRDIILGGIVFASLNEPRTLRRVLGWASVAGLADGLTLAAMRGPRPQHAVHFGGFAVLALLALSTDA